MGATININNRTVVHKSSGGVSVASPDVCKTPTSAGPTPIPYPNVSKSADTSNGTSTVKGDKNPVMVKESLFSTSTGDESGTAGGGVVSGKTKGKAEFVNYSFDVMFDGLNACRLGDPMLQNKGSAWNTPPACEVQSPLPPAIPLRAEIIEAVVCDPCDVADLTLTNAEGGASVTCTTKARSDDSLSSEDKAFLGQYDVLLECMADFENDWKIKPTKKVRLEMQSTRSPSGECSVDTQHPSVFVSALLNGDDADGLPNNTVPASSLVPPHTWDFFAPSIRSNSGRRKGWLASYWNFNSNEKRISVVVNSCGVAEQGAANGKLKGLVKIYPLQSWKLTLKIPAFKKIKHSVAATVDKDGNRSLTKSSSSVQGYKDLRQGESTSKTTVTNKRNNTNTESETYVHTRGAQVQSTEWKEGTTANGDAVLSEKTTTQNNTLSLLGGRSNTFESSESTDEAPTNTLASALKVNPAFSLTVNDQPLDITKSINNILLIATRLKDEWEKIKKLVPTVGLKAEFDVSILEGDISAEWGYRSVAEQPCERIARIEQFYRFSVEVMLFKVSLIVKFGVDVSVENWLTGGVLVAVEVSLSGTISVELPFKAELTASDDNLQGSGMLSAKSKAKIEATAKAIFLDVSCTAKVSIDGGFAINAEFKCGFKQDPLVDAKIHMLPLVVHVLLETSLYDPYKKDIELLKGREIWAGQFPKPE